MVDSTYIAWPRKQCKLAMFVIDSRPWNDFAMRDDDIVIATWAKAGTTWMQQIVGQLIFKDDPNRYGQHESPWIEIRLREGEAEHAAAQTHRRFLKSHLPIESIVCSPKARYIYVGRDGRDCYWSFHHHRLNFLPRRASASAASTPTNRRSDIRTPRSEWRSTTGSTTTPSRPGRSGATCRAGSTLATCQT
jgi:hypothetical protein